MRHMPRVKPNRSDLLDIIVNGATQHNVYHRHTTLSRLFKARTGMMDFPAWRRLCRQLVVALARHGLLASPVSEKGSVHAQAGCRPAGNTVSTHGLMGHHKYRGRDELRFDPILICGHEFGCGCR